MSERMIAFKKKRTKKTPETKSKERTAKYIQNSALELQKFGTVSHLNRDKKNTIWLRENRIDLIDAIDTWIKAYQSKFNDKTNRQRVRMVKLLEFLKKI